MIRAPTILPLKIRALPDIRSIAQLSRVARTELSILSPEYSHICLRPQHHWTDQKIEVHVFCCVMALMLCSLLRRELQHQGIDLSIPALLEELGKIREVGVVYPPRDKRRSPTIKMTLSKLSEQQQKLYDTLDLERYRAT